jgi:hypothetical protein
LIAVEFVGDFVAGLPGRRFLAIAFGFLLQIILTAMRTMAAVEYQVASR